MRTLSWMAVALLFASALPAAPAPAGSFGGSHGIYLGNSQILDVGTTRQLTLREEINQYVFSPSGEKIAYVTYTEDHGERAFSIKIVDTWRAEPEIKTVVKQIAASDADDPSGDPLLNIVGWAGDDQYLLYQRISRKSGAGNEAVAGSTALERLDLTASPPAVQPVPVEVSDTSESFGGLNYAWAPDHSRLLLGQYLYSSSAASPGGEKNWTEKKTYFFYDPLKDQLQPIRIDQSDSTLVIVGWLDDGRLLMHRSTKGGKTPCRIYEIASGAVTDSPSVDLWKKSPDVILSGRRDMSVAVNPKDPTLSLDIASHHLPDSQKTDTAAVSTVWIVRSPSAKALCVLPLGVAPGESAPQAQWAPSGKSVAFVAHGDLFLSTLIKRPADPREKLTAGEPLTCKEMNLVASENLKQIGLAMIQYMEDDDEHFPPSAGYQALIAPYLKDANIFSVGGNAFTYTGNEKMTLAAIDSPADFVLGRIDTPCGHNVLLLDGHVKTFDDQQWEQWQKENPQQKL